MQYLSLYNSLKEQVDYSPEQIKLDCGLILRNFDFISQLRFSHPECSGNEYSAMPAALTHEDPISGPRILLNKTDLEIEENLQFRYHVMLPPALKKVSGIVIMFHGFNEKYWTKYLPWAAHITAATGKAVVMFPIAFHMNRAPSLWSDSRSMYKLSHERKVAHPNTLHSSLSNVAISTRLHNKPERFIWSGLESYYDVIDFIEGIKRGEHPAIEAEASIDFCSYSIGTFLGQIIMMTNKGGYFSRSRYATFCGGPVFNRLSPVSKFILDSEANVRLYSYLVEHLESHIKACPGLGKLLSGEYAEGVNFRSLLNYNSHLCYREEKLREMANRFYAVGLANDTVVPPYEIVNTLQGSRRDIDIRVDIVDLPYAYRHEDPFPENKKIASQVDAGF